MLKALMASALILGSTLSISAPVAAQTSIQGSNFNTSAAGTAKTQQTLQKKSYQIAQRGSAYVCTRDRYGYLRLRTGPSLRNRIIGRINNGEYLTILRSSSNWYKVNHQGRIGWVSGDYVCGGSEPSQPTYTPTPTRKYDGYVCTRDRNGYLNLRQRPSTRSRILTTIPNGTQFIWYGGSRNTDFVRFEYKGIDGWVSSRYLCF
ncbi:MAG: SH3 domain-containing protein [Cyanobacteria bacterium P01_D01_bin.116]